MFLFLPDIFAKGTIVKKMLIILALANCSMQHLAAIDSSAASFWTKGIGSLPDAYVVPITAVATITGAFLCAYKWGLSQNDSEQADYINGLQDSWLGEKILDFFQHDKDSLRYYRIVKNALFGGSIAGAIAYTLALLYSTSGAKKFALWYVEAVFAAQIIESKIESWEHVEKEAKGDPQSYADLKIRAISNKLKKDKRVLINAAAILGNVYKQKAYQEYEEQKKRCEEAYKKIGHVLKVMESDVEYLKKLHEKK